MTVLENYIEGGGTVYFRNYTVANPPVPTGTLAPCPSNQALLTVTDTAYPLYVVQLNGSGPEIPVTRGSNRVAITPGTTSLLLSGRYAADNPCGAGVSLPLRVLPPAVQPVISRVVRNAARPGAASLAFGAGSLPAEYTYALLRDGQPLAPPVAVAPGSPSLALASAPAGSYNVQRTDLCGGSLASSDPVHTLDLQPIVATGGRNQLDFSYGDPALVQSLSLERNGAALVTLPPGTMSYVDTDVICGTLYRYRLTATLRSGATTVNSDSIVAVSGAVLPRPRVTASFSLQNVVQLTATLPVAALPAGSTLHYRRSTAGGPALDIATASSTGLARDTASLARLLSAPPCYTARLVDVCGTASAESPATCPALLRAVGDPDEKTASLSWSPFQGPEPAQPATTTLLSLDARGRVLSRVDVTGRTTYFDAAPPADRQILRYRLATLGAGLPAADTSYSNLATVTRQPRLVMPTAFTPNGDGLNDLLELKGKFLTGFTFVVVDRNGQEVFRSTDRSQSWDGRIGSHAPVNGAYVWRFQQFDETGKMMQQTGTVTVLQ